MSTSSLSCPYRVLVSSFLTGLVAHMILWNQEDLCWLMYPLILVWSGNSMHSDVLQIPAAPPKSPARKGVVRSFWDQYPLAESSHQHPKAYEFDYRIAHWMFWTERSRVMELTVKVMGLSVP